MPEHDTFLIPGSWELASLACKVILYMALAGIVGGSASAALFSDGSRGHLQFCLRYKLILIVLGFQASLLYFLIQVGQIVDNGLVGMFDLEMAGLLLDTQNGDVSFLRLVGLLIALVANAWFLRMTRNMRRPPSRGFFKHLLAVNLFAALVLACGFAVSGHVSVQPLTSKVAIVLHVLAMGAWIGSILPLLWLARHTEREQARQVCAAFGRYAIIILLVLLLTALQLATGLLGAFSELIETAYGRALLFKLGLVLLLLGIAAGNKWVLVPGADTSAGSSRLRLAFRVEAAVAFTVFLVTAYLSTIIGPMQQMPH